MIVAKSADRYFGLHEQKIIEEGFNPDYSLESESIFTLSNEHMGIRGYFEEGGVNSLRGSYLGGVYEAQPHRPESNYRGFVDRTHYMITTADCLSTKLTVAGEELNLTACSFSNYYRELDLSNGLLLRRFTWYTARAGKIDVVLERLISMDRPDQLVQRITLTALDMDATVMLNMGIDGNIVHQTTQRCQWNDVSNEHQAPDDTLVLRTATTDMNVRYRLLTQCDGTLSPMRTHRGIDHTYSFTLKQNKTSIASRTVSVQVARSGENLPEAQPFADFATVLDENTRHWHAFWAQSDVEIQGDLQNQQGVRYCLFQLHSTYRGLDMRNNIGAKGLTGESYNGHAFWDTETYCLPFYLFSEPKAAKGLLMFRYYTLPEAMKRAAKLDLKGACYPIATLDGTEACTLWQHSSLQMQPSTSVAYAIQTYAELTDDQEFLKREGAEMLVEIARYLLSRGGWNEQGFGFYGVMGPDEFHMMVNNDFYTNYLGKKSMIYAANVIDRLTPKELERLIEKSSLSADEPIAWRKAADQMILLHGENDVFEQHEGYFSLPHTDIQAIAREEFPLYDHWSYDRIYRTDMLKQPAVLMAMFLYPDDFTDAQKEANYAYYEPRCIHESSLSPSVHAIIASGLGRHEEALDFFGFATRLDLDNYNRNTREGLHMSSVAAAWLTIVEGFGGVRFTGGNLSIAPWLPEGWTKLSFSLRIKDSILRAKINATDVTLSCEGSPLRLAVYGKPLTIGETPVSCITERMLA